MEVRVLVLAFNLSELITFVISLVVFSLVMFDAIRMRVKARKFQALQIQAEVNNMILTTQLDQITSNRDSANIEQTEGFLKFVSDSRDWAFEYIEDIQMALRAYDIAIGMDDAKLRSDAYKKLISFLPEDS
jgi:hypothetical protein